MCKDQSSVKYHSSNEEPSQLKATGFGKDSYVLDSKTKLHNSSGNGKQLRINIVFQLQIYTMNEV